MSYFSDTQESMKVIKGVEKSRNLSVNKTQNVGPFISWKEYKIEKTQAKYDILFS